MVSTIFANKMPSAFYYFYYFHYFHYYLFIYLLSFKFFIFSETDNTTLF